MSDESTILYSPEASTDLQDIYSYIACDLLSPDIAERQISRIVNTIKSLDILPSRYPIVDYEPWKSMKMHKVPIDNFIIFYTVSETNQSVTMIRILYGGRNVESILSTSK